MKKQELIQLIKECYREVLQEEVTPQYKALIKRAKQLRISTASELRDLIADEFDDESNPITGADYEEAKKQLKIRESKTNRRSISESKFGKLYPEDCIPEKTYLIGYRAHEWKSIFKGWKLSSKKPVMLWQDTDDTNTWESYMFHGQMCVGTSADLLKIIDEIA